MVGDRGLHYVTPEPDGTLSYASLLGTVWTVVDAILVFSYDMI